ncbi:MAG: hypothetical protein K1X94_34630 [Sandaracinaceae bacterium]|nr:hypothetical protein [Sandaracinaceae bacterium]
MSVRLALALVATLLVPSIAGARTHRTARLDGIPETGSHKASSSDAVRLDVHGSAGFPSPVNVGGGLLFGRAVELGFEYGFLPTVNLEATQLGYQTYSGDLRIYPWPSGPFFFGARLGRQKLTATVSQALGPYGSASGTLTGDGWYLNPRMGLSWSSSWGLSAGIDAGFRVPLSHRVQQDLPNGIEAPAAAVDTVDYLVGKVIPTVTVLQLGLLF